VRHGVRQIALSGRFRTVPAASTYPQVRPAIGHHLRGLDTPEYRPLKAVAPVRLRSGLQRISAGQRP
jgi:hypothetical protein